MTTMFRRQALSAATKASSAEKQLQQLLLLQVPLTPHRASRIVPYLPRRHASTGLKFAIAPSKGGIATAASLNPALLLPSSTSSTTTRRKSTMTTHTTLKEALSNNETWASDTHSSKPEFFAESAKGQAPKILWLGCSDSRVPESTILNLPPGAVFTHRNIANIFTSSDLSSLSVIEYAVAHVGVQHVVVCGHTSCGGVAAALANRRIGVIDAWLQPLRAVRGRLVREGRLGEAAGAIDAAEQSLRLVEENVREGVRTVRGNPNVIRAAADRGLTVHGLVYHLDTGKLRELEVEEDEADVKARIEACTCE